MICFFPLDFIILSITYSIREYVGSLIGKHGTSLSDIIERSGVGAITIQENAGDPNTTFSIQGRRVCLNLA
jgi:hypothetical protein